jgi:hypothetical protein
MAKKNSEPKTELSTVRQGNDFVKCFYKMTAEQQNIFYYAVAVLSWNCNPFEKYFSGKPLSELKANSFCASFKIQDLFEKMDLPTTKNYKDVYYRNFGELSETIIKSKNEKGKTTWTPLFSQTIWYGDQIDIVFNPFFFDLIFEKNYTSADLKILGQLSKNAKNNYAQRLYFYLAMYRNTQGEKRFHNTEKGEWKVKITEEYFRELVQMADEENKRKDSFRRMIKNLVAKINSCNSEFVTSVDFGGYGSSEMIFICNENLNLWKIGPNEKNKDKLLINQQEREIAYYKKKYPDEWQEVYKDFSLTPVLFEELNLTKKQTDEYQTMIILKERYSRKSKEDQK